MSSAGDKSSSVDWHTPYIITSVSRADLKDIGFNESEIATLTEEDMRQIAREMEETYLGIGLFWESLKTNAQQFLEKRKGRAGASLSESRKGSSEDVL